MEDEKSHEETQSDLLLRSTRIFHRSEDCDGLASVTIAANQAMDSDCKTKGVNVAPTWFTLSSNSGAYESLADKSYVDRGA